MLELVSSALVLPFALMLIHERASSIGRASIKAVTRLLPSDLRAEATEQRLADLDDVEGGAWKLLYTIGIVWGCFWTSIGLVVASWTRGPRSYLAREMRVYQLSFSFAGATAGMSASDMKYLRRHMLEVIKHVYDAGAMSSDLTGSDRAALVKSAVANCLLARDNPIIGEEWAKIREELSSELETSSG